MFPRGEIEDPNETTQSGAESSIGVIFLKRIVSATRLGGVGGVVTNVGRGLLQIIEQFNANVSPSGMSVQVPRY